jgi:hypothetical protein
VALAGQVSEPLLTCEAVLAEAAFHLGSVPYVLSLVREKLVRPALDLSREMDRIRLIADRFADRRPDVADVCLIRLSELHPRHSVLTVDVEDFHVYRRNRNESIPVITPPSGPK